MASVERTLFVGAQFIAPRRGQGRAAGKSKRLKRVPVLLHGLGSVGR